MYMRPGFPDATSAYSARLISQLELVDGEEGVLVVEVADVFGEEEGEGDGEDDDGDGDAEEERDREGEEEDGDADLDEDLDGDAESPRTTAPDVKGRGSADGDPRGVTVACDAGPCIVAVPTACGWACAVGVAAAAWSRVTGEEAAAPLTR